MLDLGPALHGFGARLQDVELAVAAVAAPFDVHRAAVVLLDHQRVFGQLDGVGVAERIAVALLGRRVLGLHQLALCRTVARREHHALQLRAEPASDDRLLACAQHRLVHVELVGVDAALNHHLPEAVARGDEHHLIEARFGVDREHHAGAPEVGAHHALHAGRQGDVAVRVALVDAVADGTVVVQRREHLLDLLQHAVDVADIQEGFLLAGKRGVGQVFGGGRRAHRVRRSRVAGGQLVVGRANRLLERRRQRGGADPAADLGAGLRQGLDVVDIQRSQLRADALGQAAVAQELAKRVRRGGKPTGHTHTAGRELADHFAEAGVLAADRLDIGHPQLVKRYDQGGRQ